MLIPRSLDEVTSSWLTAALRSGGRDVEVTGSRATVIGEGVGEMTLVARLEMEGHGAVPSSAILKMASASSQRRDMAREMSTYEREFTFYDQVAPHVQARFPQAYAREIDGRGEYFYLLMEDFPHHVNGDDIAGCSPAVAAQCLRAVAPVHAAFTRPGDDAVPPQVLFYRDFPGRGMEARMASGWSTLVEEYGHHIPQLSLGDKDDWIGAYRAVRHWLATGRGISHGDFRLDNLMFGPPGDPDPVVLIDWQGSVRSRGMQDVSYLLTHCMSTEDRREAERALLTVYRDALAACGVGVEADELYEEYRRGVIAAFASTVVICGSLGPTSARARERAHGLVARMGAALDDIDARELVKVLVEEACGLQ